MVQSFTLSNLLEWSHAKNSSHLGRGWIVAGWKSSFLALIASCSLFCTSSINPETLRVAAIQVFRPSAIVQVLGQNDTFVFWNSLVSWGKWLSIQNRFCAEKGGIWCLRLSPSLVWGQSCVKCRHVSHAAENHPSRHCWNKFLTLTWPLLTNSFLLQKPKEIHKDPRLNRKMLEQCERPLNLLLPQFNFLPQLFQQAIL